MNEPLCDLWTMKFEILIIPMCHKVFCFFQPFKNMKFTVSSRAIEKQVSCPRL